MSKKLAFVDDAESVVPFEASNSLGPNRKDSAMTDNGTSRGVGRTGRLQLVVTEVTAKRLETLRERTEAASYAEVIRRALLIYEGILAEADDGSSIIVRRPDGSEEALPLNRII